MQATGDDVNNAGNADDTFTVSGRAHWNPVLTEGHVVHLGISGYYERLPSTVTATPINAWVGSHFNDNTQISSGPLRSISDSHAIFAEAVLIWGKFWTFGEYGQRRFTSRDVSIGHFDHHAYSVQAGYFLAGDGPGYLSKTGQWGKPAVANPVGEGGHGAIEIAGRYEALDMSDQTNGGQGWAATAGVNWYMTSIVRLILDYSRWYINNRTGNFLGPDDGNTLSTRIQLAF